jgi:pimeloyl-ACP methyl ester carboxylesterase
MPALMSVFGGKADIERASLTNPDLSGRGIMTDITIANNNTKLAASVYGPSAAAPILFLHGISLSRDTWEEIAQRLSPTYCIWALDFRGHGHSDRSSRYELVDYVSDAEAALATINRPAIVVGHSLGGCIAGMLAQTPHPLVSAVFLEDPPWYLGKSGEWDRTQFPKLFAIISAKQAAWQKENAPLATYQAFLANAPSPVGGIHGVDEGDFGGKPIVTVRSADLSLNDN